MSALVDPVQQMIDLVDLQDRATDLRDRIRDRHRVALRKFLQGWRVDVDDVTIEEVHADVVRISYRDYDGYSDEASIDLQLFTDPDAFFVAQQQRQDAVARAQLETTVSLKQSHLEAQQATVDRLQREIDEAKQQLDEMGPS